MSGSQQLLLGGIPTAVPVDPYFYSVTSLLHGDGTNGGQNNTFLDSSSNNFTITRNGNTTQGSFSPFSQTGWGGYFDGSGDFLNFTKQTTTGSFTCECWFYRGEDQTNYHIVFGGSSASVGVDNNQMIVQNDGAVRLTLNATAIISASGTGSVAKNQWNHIAWVRSGTSCAIFVNGNRVGTGTSNAAVNIDRIGSLGGVGAGYDAIGYISNARITTTAVYDPSLTTCTVPTAPLTAVTGTYLLTLQSNRFVDNSASPLTITVNGNTSIQPFSPFNPTTAYSTSAVGGSGYFDGSGDSLTFTDSSNALDLGGATASFECWIYAPNVSSGQGIFNKSGNTDSWNTSNGYEYNVYITGGTINFYYNNAGTGTTGVSGSIVANQWTHVAVATNSSNAISLYINGTRVSTATNAITKPTTRTSMRIGNTVANEFFSGYISGLRFISGSGAYDASQTTITIPTAPPTAIANTQLLCNFTNGAIFDNAAVADYETVGNAQISTSVKKYGTGSIAFDGTGDWLLTKATTPFDLGTGNMTFECWFYITNTVADYRMLASDATNGFNYVCLRGGGTGGQIEVNVNGTSFRFNLNNTVSQNTWTHLAVVRIGSTWIAYINGLSLGTNTSSGSFNLGNGGMYVGRFGGSPAYEWPGYIDDLRISKGVARYPYNFTPPTAEFPNIGGTVTLTADPYFDYTTLLLPGNGTNGAQNNTFLDSSTNNFTITRNGNTTQGTFSPFSQTGWGAYFDGTGDYLSVPDAAAFTLGTSDFCMESWVYPVNAGTGASESILGQWSSASYGWIFQYRSNKLLMYYSTNGSSTTNAIDATATIVNNAWNHIAFVRSGNTLSAYVNGVRVSTNASFTASIVNSSSTVNVGRNGDNSEYVTGYLSNTRLVVGSSVYDPTQASFTVPTAPLTAITNTSLLTCQSNRFIDNSTNNFAITRNGDVSVQAFSPFNPTAAWSAATNGGSGYFDGSGDTLSVAYNAALQLTSSTVFTIEGFVYFNSTGAQQYVLSNWTTGGAGYAIATGVAAFGNTELAFFDGTTWRKIGDVTVGQWYHFAIASSGTSNSAYLYLNGVQTTGAFTVSANISNGSTGLFLMSQNNSSAYTNGYLSTFRVVKGTNVYPSGTTFTPPTTPLTAIANTSLLCNFTNAGIYDATSKNDLETVGNAQISTTQSKFGGSSMYFDGTGDYLALPVNDLTNFGSGDFTIEGWVRIAATGSFQVLFNRTLASVSGYGGTWIRVADTNVLQGAFSSGTSSHDVVVTGSTALATGTWYHFAWVRYGTSFKIYLNGVSDGSGTSSATMYASGDRVNVATQWASGSPTNQLNGYINDLRITKGIARYTSNFTPPSTAFLTL